MKALFGGKSALLVALVLLALCVPASAKLNFMGGLHFNGGFPQGEFKDQLNKDAFGLGGQFFYAPETSPFGIGIELGWMNYGNEKRREPFSSTVPDVTVEVTRSNNLVEGFFIFRGQVPRGPIRPYADAMVGFNYFFTKTTISNSDDPSHDVASSTNQDDAVFAYGFGGGAMVQVYDGPKRSGKPLQVFIDAGLRYVLGGEAEYLKKGSIQIEGTTVSYTKIKSKTDLLRLHVGVMFRF
jgi:hypothetical protein